MSAHERTVWNVVMWCEARGIPAPQWSAFATWYADQTAQGLRVAFHPAYEQWVAQGQPNGS